MNQHANNTLRGTIAKHFSATMPAFLLLALCLSAFTPPDKCSRHCKSRVAASASTGPDAPCPSAGAHAGVSAVPARTDSPAKMDSRTFIRPQEAVNGGQLKLQPKEIVPAGKKTKASPDRKTPPATEKEEMPAYSPFLATLYV